MTPAIETREQLDAILDQWRAQGFGSESMSRTPWYSGFAIEKYGFDKRRRCSYPFDKDSHIEPCYLVQAVKYTMNGTGPLARLLDDGHGKYERRSVRISEALAREIGVAR